MRFLTFLISLFISAFSYSDVKSIDGVIKFDINSDSYKEAQLDEIGLHLGAVGSSNLNVNGNAIVSSLSIGSNLSSSNLHINGTVEKSYELVTGNATLSEGASLVLLNLSSASHDVDLWLPSAGNSAQQILDIKMISGSFNAHLRSADGIDHAFKITLGPLGNRDYSSKISLFSSGHQWYIMGGLDDSVSSSVLSISDNLLGHWPFDETTGLVAHDVSGQGHHAIIQGRDDVVWSDGQVEGAVFLDGDSEYFFAGDELSLNNTDFSVTFWEQRASSGNNNYVVGQGYGSTRRGLHLGFRNSDFMTFAFFSDDFNSPATYTTSEWRHWSFTYDYSSRERKLYLNGSLIATNTANGNYNPSNTALYLGANYNADRSFHGFIDDIRIYNKVLETIEIDEILALDSYEFSPVLGSATASDTNNTTGVGVGDNLTLTFSEATNEPAVTSKNELDQLIDWFGNSLGQGYSGTWSDNKTLVITVTDASGASIEVGDRIRIKENSAFTYIDNSSLWVHGSVVIDGLFTWFNFSDNLIAHYPFDNNNDQFVFDIAGNHHLSIQGNGNYYPAGKIGLGLHFEGDLLATTTGVNVSSQSQTTLLWEKRGSVISSDQSQVRIGSEESNGKSYRMKYNTSNNYLMDMWGSSRTTSQSFTSSEWRHWAYSYDNDLRTQRLYLNGNLILSESSDSYNFTGDTRIFLGAQDGDSELYYGTLDDVRIYNRVLSQSEIQQIYHYLTEPSLEPSLVRAHANDPDFDDDGISNGDNLILFFSYPTNTPSMSTKADLDMLIDFENYSLGTDYTGTWTDNQTLSIRVVDATNANLMIGANIGVLDTGNLQSISGSSTNVVTKNIELTGSWGRVAASNLIAYYNLDESSGLVANDSISGNHAALDSGMDDSNWVTGYYGNGIKLEGANDELSIAGGNFSFSDNSFAFSVWEQRANTGTDDYIFSQGTSTSSLGLHVGYRADGRYTLAFWGNDLNVSLNFTEGSWRHWVMCYDDSSQLQSLYLNGDLMLTRTASANFQGSGTLYFGSRFSSSSTHYEGVLDEIKIYDRALTSEEVKNLYNP